MPKRDKADLWLGKVGRTTHTVYGKKTMVVVGTMGAGFDFYGPFDDLNSVDEWVRQNLHVGTPVHVELFNDVRSGA